MKMREGTGESSVLRDAFHVRRKVFIEEQNVPESIERDEIDAGAWHVVFYLDGHPVATGRLFQIEGKAYGIGRVAVRKSCRGTGTGKRVMHALLKKAWQLGATYVEIHAQAHACAFYEGLGFEKVGNTFMEAGIEHVTMRVKS